MYEKIDTLPAPQLATTATVNCCTQSHKAKHCFRTVCKVTHSVSLFLAEACVNDMIDALLSPNSAPADNHSKQLVALVVPIVVGGRLLLLLLLL